MTDAKNIDLAPVRKTGPCDACPDPAGCRVVGQETTCPKGCGWTGLLPHPEEGHALGYKPSRCPGCGVVILPKNIGTERGERWRCRQPRVTP